MIAIYYIIRTFKQYRIGKYSPRNTVLWVGFWIGLMFLALLPDTIPNSIARGLGFKDHINAIIFVALGFLFLMVFHLSAAVNRIEDKMTTLVRKIALEKASIKHNLLPPNIGSLSKSTKRKSKVKTKRSTST